MDDDSSGIDLSPLHRELDRLKVRLCRCDHRGECLACRGFEILRQQSQMVVAAASQPVLHQVAQEAAMHDLVSQLTGASEKLTSDTRLQELIGELMERVQEDLGGAEAMQKMFGEFGMPGFPGGSGGFPGGAFPGFPGAGRPAAGSGPTPEATPTDPPPARRDVPYDDMTPEERERRRRDASSGDSEAPGGV
ncbi:MAG TPA: hypothetical protein VFO60_03465 [Candidatus Dormibacteraeota bacterium]|nr:hypothetical protein [Candidatus Dormibacteraeota bacterium]